MRLQPLVIFTSYGTKTMLAPDEGVPMPGRLTQWRIDLPWATPLNMNDSPGVSKNAMYARAREVKEWRLKAGWLATAARIPRLERFTVELHYQPAVNRRRDTHNLGRALKPLVDGLVDAKVCVDDDTVHYVGTEPTIHAAVPGEPAALWLIVRDLGHLPGTQQTLDLFDQPGSPG